MHTEEIVVVVAVDSLAAKIVVIAIAADTTINKEILEQIAQFKE